MASCTAQKNDGSFCDRPSLRDAPFPICVTHTAELYRFIRQHMDAAAETTLSVLETLDTAWNGGRKFKVLGESIVYYVEVGPLIKIGTTTDLERRIAQYPPGSKLLATEPGGREVESKRHYQFQDCLADRREWFHPNPELLSHVAALASDAA